MGGERQYARFRKSGGPYQLAAEGGCTRAQFTVGLAHEVVKFKLEVDEKEALKWHKMATEGAAADTISSPACHARNSTHGGRSRGLAPATQKKTRRGKHNK